MTEKYSDGPFVFNDDVFCDDIDDLFNHLALDYGDNLEDLDDDWTAKVELTQKEPMINFNKDWILQNIDEERVDEDGECLEKFSRVLDMYEAVLSQINEKVPKLWYGTNRYAIINKRDLFI